MGGNVPPGYDIPDPGGRILKVNPAEEVPSRYVDKLVRLAWPAPDITEAILGGQRLRDYSLTELLEADIPMDWERQRAALVVV